ncbi:MAG TPA: hypothetical protein VLT36_18550 [Candidatus Dormibacteraeota bacterium]|nr:hypothetical protein [Candidatus Dormibacteraeota bacterium]
MSESLRAQINRIQTIALVVGIIALALSAFGAFHEPTQFFFSYLFACLFWVGLSLGCFLVTMIHQLTGGRWGYPTRRFLEAGFMSLPLMLVLFVPVLFGFHHLYPWAQPHEVAANTVLQQRHAYLNGWAFIIRAAFFFLIVLWMAGCLRRWSLDQDTTPDATPTRKARTLSGPGVVLFVLLATMAYVDWIMSLEKRWYSTIFPIIILAGQILLAYAFSIIMLTAFRGHEPLAAVVSTTHYHHLGNLLLTFVLFWTYVSFGQLLIVFSGDLPPEIEWYLHRIAGSWKWVLAALALFHFFLPFFLLLFRAVKTRASSLTTLAVILFIMHMFDAYWLVMPSLHQHGIAVSWLDFTCVIGIGGVWFAFFFWRLKAAALLPQHDPGMQFAFVYGH